MAYSIDRWIRKVTIPAGGRTLRVSAGASAVSVTIAAGDYWCHGSSSIDYPGLYQAISAALTTLFSISARAHSPYALYPQCGIEFYRTAVPTQFTFHFSDPLFTLDRRLLGFPASWATDVTSVDSVLRAPMSTWGSWVAGRPARRKIAFPTRDIAWSTEDTASAAAYEVDWGARVKTAYQYAWCQAAIVHPSRGLLEDHCGAAGILVGDQHNAFRTIWDSLAALETVLVVHDVAEQAGLTLTNWEAVKIASQQHAASFEAVAQLVGAGGEFYDLTIPTVRVDAGTYGQ